MITPLEATKYFTEHQDWKTAGDDTQYLIECDKDRNVILVFQGSNSDIDWKNNFRFWKKPYKDMEIPFRVHSGFLHCWKACEDQIAEEVGACDPSSITIIGHSYGSALSVLASEYFFFHYITEREKYPDESRPSLRGKIDTICFGGPRVIGFLNFKKVKERWEGVRLFNNSSDIVCAVPPFFFLYRHVTEQIHIGKLRHWWDFFRPDKWHDVRGDYGYKHYIELISK